MGHLIDGKWKNDEVATSDESGAFDREESQYREKIHKDHPKYQPSKNRYHLYVSYACPWAHRTLITRKLKGLEKVISVDVVHPDMLENSWTFKKDFDGATGDSLYNLDYLYQIYLKDKSDATTKVTVPVLWDKETGSIVNNESSEILRILNDSFNDLAEKQIDLCPENLKSEISEVNELVYEPINNGVYKTGFAKNQEAYEKAFKSLFEALDTIEQRLEGKRFLVGDQLTEADIRLLTTLIRFDSVYYVHFKCNYKKISEYKNISKYLESMFELEGVKETTRLDHIKRHYYYSHDFINPNRIVPLGPDKALPRN
jgi:putative glutathione S-transferase